MLTYKTRNVSNNEVIDVYLQGKKIGSICKVQGGYQYQINSKHKGEVFPSVQAVKYSLMND